MAFDLARRIGTAGGWSDVGALLDALAGRPSDGPDPAVDIPVPSPGLPGQTGIRLRAALAAGDARLAAALAPELDDAHRVEILLGAALRDARRGHAAAHLFLALDALDDRVAGPARWWPLCRLFVEGEPDRRLDDLAAAYVAERRAPDRWRPSGAPLAPDAAAAIRGAPFPDVAVAAALAAGTAGDALLDAFADLPLHRPVAVYYRRGTLHALGARPLLILAATAADLPNSPAPRGGPA